MKPSRRNKAFLVVLQTWQKSKTFRDDSLSELSELTRSADVKIMGNLTANVPHPSPSHFLRHGKLEEVQQEAKAAGADILFFNIELTPAQARNIEADIKIPVMDRTGLILEIFGRRAQTREGKLQVELARLNYVLPRLGGLGGVMSRLGGGIGTRGPGETELEKDRRKVRLRIRRVKEELEKVRKHRRLIREGRKKRNFVTVSLVGYTNAGKSTLLNALTGADTYAQDKLFATLDPKTRLQSMNGRRDILFVDTVGFLKDLPHALVESFRATLEETAEADILIHVLDVSSQQRVENKLAVEKVLEEIKAGEKPVILALNKADLISAEEIRKVTADWPRGILISAREKQGMQGLMAKIEDVITAEYGDRYAGKSFQPEYDEGSS